MPLSILNPPPPADDDRWNVDWRKFRRRLWKGLWWLAERILLVTADHWLKILLGFLGFLSLFLLMTTPPLLRSPLLISPPSLFDLLVQALVLAEEDQVETEMVRIAPLVGLGLIGFVSGALVGYYFGTRTARKKDDVPE